MLRVGLTGDLGSGKSTVAAMLAERGAHVMSSDEIARGMMQPGEPVYAAIVQRFGENVLSPGGEGGVRALDRRALAKLAFAEGRVEELNAIVHPAVIAEQAARAEAIAATEPQAVVVVESALLLSTKHAGGPWYRRFDEVVVVTAPEATKIARYVDRAAAGTALSREAEAALQADAEARLRVQRREGVQDPDFIILRNDGDRDVLRKRVDAVWLTLWRKATR